MASRIARLLLLWSCVVYMFMSHTEALIEKAPKDNYCPTLKSDPKRLVYDEFDGLDVQWCLNGSEIYTTCWQVRMEDRFDYEECNMKNVSKSCYSCSLPMDLLSPDITNTLIISSCGPASNTVRRTEEIYPRCYVKIRPVYSLNAKFINSSAISLTWSPPESKTLSTVIYRISYHSERSSHEIITNKSQEVIGNLQPYTTYNFTVESRGAEHGYWSDIVTSTSARTNGTAVGITAAIIVGRSTASIASGTISCAVAVLTSVIVLVLCKKRCLSFKKVPIKLPSRQENVDLTNFNRRSVNHGQLSDRADAYHVFYEPVGQLQGQIRPAGLQGGPSEQSQPFDINSSWESATADSPKRSPSDDSAATPILESGHNSTNSEEGYLRQNHSLESSDEYMTVKCISYNPGVEIGPPRRPIYGDCDSFVDQELQQSKTVKISDRTLSTDACDSYTAA